MNNQHSPAQARARHGGVHGGALPSTGVPIALAGGVATELALAKCAAWSLAFAYATEAVRLVVASAQSLRRSGALVAVAATAGLARYRFASPWRAGRSGC